MLLAAEGYVVHSHESAQEFLNTIQKDDVGCIVTDVNMPEMSGLQLLFEMCKLRMCMPAIVISGFMDARLNQASTEQGAFRCFQKPVDLDDLLAAIHAALVHAYGGDQNLAFSS
jgi:FixJ family two-component response regulator